MTPLEYLAALQAEAGEYNWNHRIGIYVGGDSTTAKALRAMELDTMQGRRCLLQHEDGPRCFLLYGHEGKHTAWPSSQVADRIDWIGDESRCPEVWGGKHRCLGLKDHYARHKARGDGGRMIIWSTAKALAKVQ